MKKELWKGNEAIAEAAIRAGCRAYFGYPITPQNEIPEYMSRRMPESGGVFVQAESEVAAIFKKKRENGALTNEEALKFQSAVLFFLFETYHEFGWVQQLHLGALRNNNARGSRAKSDMEVPF